MRPRTRPNKPSLAARPSSQAWPRGPTAKLATRPSVQLFGLLVSSSRVEAPWARVTCCSPTLLSRLRPQAKGICSFLFSCPRGADPAGFFSLFLPLSPLPCSFVLFALSHVKTHALLTYFLSLCFLYAAQAYRPRDFYLLLYRLRSTISKTNQGISRQGLYMQPERG